jgi:hypothetical protein
MESLQPWLGVTRSEGVISSVKCRGKLSTRKAEENSCFGEVLQSCLLALRGLGDGLRTFRGTILIEAEMNRMPQDSIAAVCTGRRQNLNGAFKSVKSIELSGHSYFKRSVLLVAARIASAQHGHLALFRRNAPETRASPAHP